MFMPQALREPVECAVGDVRGAFELPLWQWSLPLAGQSRESSLLPWSVEKLRRIDITFGHFRPVVPIKDMRESGVRRWPSQSRLCYNLGSHTSPSS